MDKELGKHEEWMLSMRDAALDEEAFKKVSSNLESKGLEIQKAVPLQLRGEQLPVAWILQAVRPGKAVPDGVSD